MTGDARPSSSPSAVTPGGSLLAAVLDELDRGVALLSESNEILFANAAFRALVSPTVSPVVGTRLQAALTTIPTLEDPPMGLPGGGWEGRIRLGDEAADVSVPAYVRRIPVSDGPDVGLFVAETRGGHARWFARLRRAEGASRLARAAVHELNNVLAAVTAFAELLATTRPEGAEGEQDRADLAEIRTAARRGAAITRQLSAFGRPVDGSPEVFEVTALLRGQGGVLRRLLPAGVEMVYDLPEVGAWASADPRSLDRLLVDLMLDLAEAADGPRRLRIGVAALENPSPRRLGETTLPSGSYVVLEVDGLEPATARESAVGSAVAAGLAAAEDGLRVCVYLPAADGVDLNGEATDDVPAPAATVLLVEPEAALRAALRRVLSGAGYTTLDVADGAEALSLVREGGLRPDVIVAEAAIDSPSAAEMEVAIRRLGLGASFVFVSSRPHDPGVEALRRSGVAVLDKPVEGSGLVRWIREAVVAGEETS